MIELKILGKYTNMVRFFFNCYEASDRFQADLVTTTLEPWNIWRGVDNGVVAGIVNWPDAISFLISRPDILKDCIRIEIPLSVMVGYVKACGYYSIISSDLEIPRATDLHVIHHQDDEDLVTFLLANTKIFALNPPLTTVVTHLIEDDILMKAALASDQFECLVLQPLRPFSIEQIPHIPPESHHLFTVNNPGWLAE